MIFKFNAIIRQLSLGTFAFFLINIAYPTKFIIASEQKEDYSKNPALEKIQQDFYLLGPGDLISITFFGADELSGTFQILSDGNIQLPLLGTQSLNGLTLNQAKIKLTSLFSDELIRPELNIDLLKPRTLKVSMVGEIYRPGIYSLNFSENSKIQGSKLITTSAGYPTVVDAIQKSGGLTLEADISRITLFRRMHGEKKDYKKVQLDLLSLIKNGNQDQNPNLFDGDVIKVAKLENDINSLENVPNNLIPDEIKIYVVGEVESPGMYTVGVNTPISKAILIAGGPKTWRYQKRNIKLIRVKRNGQIDVKKLSYNEKNIEKNNKKSSLRDGDIIKVNKNLFGKSSDALSTVLPPIRDIYSLYGVYKLINE